MMAIRWPSLSVQVPADVLFNAVPLVAAINLISAWRFRRGWRLLLTLNASCGFVLGFFAAFNYESFMAGLVTTLAGTIPSVVALRSRARGR